MGGTDAFTTSLVLNLTIALVLLTAFCILRARKSLEWCYMPRYNPRRYVGPRQENGWMAPPTLPSGLFAWIPFVLRLSDDVVFNSAGLDALICTVFMRSMTKLFAFCTFFGLVVLMPLYSQLGDNEFRDEDTGLLLEPDGIDKLSLANIKEDSDVLWASFVAGILFTAIACKELRDVYLVWISYRHRHLQMTAKTGAALSVMVQFLSSDYRSDESLSKFYNKVFTGKVSSTVVARDLSKLIDLKSKVDALAWKLELAETKWGAVQEIEKKNPKKKAKRPTHRNTPLIGKKVDTIDWCNTEIKKLKDAIQEGLNKNHQCLSQGFITFHSAVAALSCEGIAAMNEAPHTMMHRFAPEPRDIYWPNLKYDYHHRRVRELVITAATGALVFFWLIPVTFVASLTTLEALSERAPWLEPIAKSNPVVKGFLEGFLPSLALLVFNIILPMVLLALARIQGIEAYSWMQISVFRKFFVFIVINNFLAVTIAGAMFDQLDGLINDPGSIVELLGNSVPKSATFFTTFTMLAAFTGIPIKLIDPGTLIVGSLMKKTLCKTEAQKERAEKPKFTKYGVDYSRHLLIFIIGFCYAPIAPIILPFSTLYFALGTLAFKYKAMYTQVPTDEGGGVIWPVVFQKLRIAMLVAQITLAGCLGLKQHPIVSPIAILIPIASWFYTGSLSDMYDSRGRYLTGEVAAELDKKLLDEGGFELPLPAASKSPSRTVSSTGDTNGYIAPPGSSKGILGKVSPLSAIKSKLSAGSIKFPLPTESSNPFAVRLIDLVTPKDENSRSISGTITLAGAADVKYKATEV